MNEEIINLDEIAPPKRIIQIRDKKIDISIIPFNITLEMMKHSSEFSKLGEMVKDGTIHSKAQGEQIVQRMETLFGIMKKILHNSDPEINDTWVDQNMSSKQVILVMNKIMEYIFEEFGDSKNAEAPQQEKQN